MQVIMAIRYVIDLKAATYFARSLKIAFVWCRTKLCL